MATGEIGPHTILALQAVEEANTREHAYAITLHLHMMDWIVCYLEPLVDTGCCKVNQDYVMNNHVQVCMRVSFQISFQISKVTGYLIKSIHCFRVYKLCVIVSVKIIILLKIWRIKIGP